MSVNKKTSEFIASNKRKKEKCWIITNKERNQIKNTLDISAWDIFSSILVYYNNLTFISKKTYIMSTRQLSHNPKKGVQIFGSNKIGWTKLKWSELEKMRNQYIGKRNIGRQTDRQTGRQRECVSEW
jgi:hypothetical protein